MAGQSVARALAVHLARHAGRVLPEGDEEWAKAIANEIEYLPTDHAALAWAVGCVYATYRDKFRIEARSVSRWLLSVEMLICFLPLTVFAYAVVAAVGGGYMPFDHALIGLSAAAIGPVGFAVAIRVVAMTRAPLNAVVDNLLRVAPVWTVVAFCLPTLRVGSEALEPLSGEWPELALIALLPALGSAHLLCITRRPGDDLAED